MFDIPIKNLTTKKILILNFENLNNKGPKTLSAKIGRTSISFEQIAPQSNIYTSLILTSEIGKLKLSFNNVDFQSIVTVDKKTDLPNAEFIINLTMDRFQHTVDIISEPVLKAYLQQMISKIQSNLNSLDSAKKNEVAQILKDFSTYLPSISHSSQDSSQFRKTVMSFILPEANAASLLKTDVGSVAAVSAVTGAAFNAAFAGFFGTVGYALKAYSKSNPIYEPEFKIASYIAYGIAAGTLINSIGYAQEDLHQIYEPQSNSLKVNLAKINSEEDTLINLEALFNAPNPQQWGIRTYVMDRVIQNVTKINTNIDSLNKELQDVWMTTLFGLTFPQ